MEAKRGKEDRRISSEKFEVSHPSNPRVCLWLQRNGFQRKTTLSFAERFKLIGKLTQVDQEAISKEDSVEFGGACKQVTERREFISAARASRSFLVSQSKGKDSSACNTRLQRTDEGARGYTVVRGNGKLCAPDQGNYARRRTQSMPTQLTQPFFMKRELENLPGILRSNGSVHIKNNYASLRKYSLTNLPKDWRRIPECRPKNDEEGNAGASVRAQDNFDSKFPKPFDTGRGEKFGKDTERVIAGKGQLPTGLYSNGQPNLPTINPDYTNSDSASSNDSFYNEGQVESLQSYSFECTTPTNSVKKVSKLAMYASKSNILSWLQDVQQCSTTPLQRAEALLSIETSFSQ